MQMQEYRSRYDSLAVESAWFNIPGRKEYLLKQIGRSKRILDVGCLGGQLTRLFADRNNEVVGLELNAHAAKQAERLGVQVKVADVEQGIPFEAESFDVVHAGDVLESLYDTQQFFHEAARVLKPRGLFLFSTPNLNSIENRVKVLTGGYLSMSGAFPEDHFGDHIRQFNVPKLEELCARNGFEIEDVVGVHSLLSRGPWVDRGMALLGKVLPEFSKLLIVKARRLPRA